MGRVAVRPGDLVAGPTEHGHQQKLQVQPARAAYSLLRDVFGGKPSDLHYIQDRCARDRGGDEGGD